MFNNIGGKIKTIAQVLCWLGIGASVILGIIMFVTSYEYYEEQYIAAGWTCLIVGPIASLISAYMMYGFGELIEKATEIAANTAKMKKISAMTNQPIPNTKAWRCEKCGNMTNRTPCAFCGHVPSEDDKENA